MDNQGEGGRGDWEGRRRTGTHGERAGGGGGEEGRRRAVEWICDSVMER